MRFEKEQQLYNFPDRPREGCWLPARLDGRKSRPASFSLFIFSSLFLRRRCRLCSSSYFMVLDVIQIALRTEEQTHMIDTRLQADFHRQFK